MSDYMGLIAELDEGCNDGGDLPSLLGRARATIEALVKERDELKREMQARELHHFEEEQRSVGFAAQLAKLSRLVGDGAPHWVLRRHISATPADALREHDAALIESLADEEVPAAVEARRWLRERARQVREGEA